MTTGATVDQVSWLIDKFKRFPRLIKIKLLMMLSGQHNPLLLVLIHNPEDHPCKTRTEKEYSVKQSCHILNDIWANEDYKTIDDISSSFNGSTTSFALQVGGSALVPFPKFESQCIICRWRNPGT